MADTVFAELLKTRDFEYWSTGQHKIEAPAFFEMWARGEAVMLDVRDQAEADFIAFPFALHIPIHQLPERLDEIPRDKLVATFCSGGDRANVASAFLHAHGFDNVRILKGGYANLIPELMPGKVRRLKTL